ncbi:MAG: hypothetical protein E7405_05480 [Ruminococcaceae bacterium]|nr:hypothetical protein [Oscillospiraceae bacterium]
MKKRILNIIVALSLVLSALPVAYAVETDENNPSEKTSFTIDLNNSMYAVFETKNPNQIKSLSAIGSSTSKKLRFYRVDSTYATPYESAILAFTTSASALGDDEKVYLNLNVDGYKSTDKTTMSGGKIKVIYSLAGYPAKTELDKSVYILSEDKITNGTNSFKIDVTSMVKTALSNATAVGEVKTIELLVEVDPYDTPLNANGDKFVREDNEERQFVGGVIQYGTNAPALTVEEITPELSDIKIDGVSLTCFESSTLEYTYNVAYSYQGLPVITPVTKYSSATAVVDGPSQIPENATITVTTPSGKSKTYTIAIGRAEVSPELTDIQIDSVSVDGFESSKEEYTHILSYNYNKTPQISVVKKDPDASADIELPSQIPGNVVINVTTPDLKSKTYKVYLKRRDVLTELSDVKVDGVSIDGFNESKKEYTYYVSDNYQGLPTVTIEKKDSDADADIIMPDSIPGKCYIDVSNYSGKVTTYKVNLRYESSKTNPTTFTTPPKVTYTDGVGTVIKTVPANGTVKATLDLRELRDESDITFITALYDDGFLIDKVYSEKQGNEVSLTNTLSVTISDVSKAKIKSFMIDNCENSKRNYKRY